MSREIYPSRLPLKSVAAALLFTVILGPLGLLYASVLGGALMLVAFFASICLRLYVSALIFWMVSCVWSVAATNHYNNNILDNNNLK